MFSLGIILTRLLETDLFEILRHILEMHWRVLKWIAILVQW
jgi:hypothetical protein